MSKIYMVTGNPIMHSKSPVMFNAAFRALGIDGIYVRLAASDAEEVMTMAREVGIDGVNVTAPFKAAIVSHLDEVEPMAQRIGAVNVVVRRAERFFGYNTDVAGLIGAVRSIGFEPAGKRAVVLGAGGAARAAAVALVLSGSDVILVNRTFDKARDAADTLGCTAAPLNHAAEALKGAHLLVSAIGSAVRLIEPSLLSKEMVVLEANYSRPTPLMEDARRAGCTVIDGREWLLAQAIPAFKLFTGKPAPQEKMRRALWKNRHDGRTHIALIGFMGTGKSAVAGELGALTRMGVIDVDKRIEEMTGFPVSEIFARMGEEAFRRMEQAEIDGIREMEGSIVSCGGGAVLNPANVRVLRNNARSVWLWADKGTILSRTRETGIRPLLDSGDPGTRIATLLKERLPLYAATSDLVIRTDGQNPKQLAERIWNEIGHTLAS